MNNITGIAVVQVGNAKRLAVTYQTIDTDGKVTADNQRINKIITNDEVLSAVTILNNFAQSIIDGTTYTSTTNTETSKTK